MKLLFILLVLCSFDLQAKEKETKQTGYIGDDYVQVKTTETKDKKTTSGYIGDKYIRVKTTKTPTGKVTTGWVGDDYVRVKEKDE